MTNEKKVFHIQVAEKLIEQLKQGTAPWQRPWEPGEPGAFLPMNPLTGKRYKGINAIQLMSQNHSDQRWMTYKQAVTLDAQVKKGEKGTAIQYWKFSEERNKKDANGKPVFDANGKAVKEEIKLERPRVFFATVFNAEQIDGLPPLEKKEKTVQSWNAVERAERILQLSGADIRHAPQNRAFYSPSTDHIQLPEKNQFETPDAYYATALHEFGHWTGHSSHLNRDLSHPFGSEGYAKEELRAEISSMILGDELGIGHDPGQHAAYVNSWIKVLQNEPMEIFRAAADAEKIQDFVLGIEQKQIQERIEQQSIKALEILLKVTPEDIEVAKALKKARSIENLGLRHGYKRNLDDVSKSALGFELPHSWTGNIEIKRCFERLNSEGWVEIANADEYNVKPTFYNIHLFCKNENFIIPFDYSNYEDTKEMSERLYTIDLYGDKEYSKDISLIDLGIAEALKNVRNADNKNWLVSRICGSKAALKALQAGDITLFSSNLAF